MNKIVIEFTPEDIIDKYVRYLADIFLDDDFDMNTIIGRDLFDAVDDFFSTGKLITFAEILQKETGRPLHLELASVVDALSDMKLQCFILVKSLEVAITSVH